MIEKLIEKLISTISDPLMLFSLVVICGLFYLLIQRDKSVRDLFLAMKEQSAGLATCNNSICGMLPLLEFLVYGKEGKGGRKI